MRKGPVRTIVSEHPKFSSRSNGKGFNGLNEVKMRTERLPPIPVRSVRRQNGGPQRRQALQVYVKPEVCARLEEKLSFCARHSGSQRIGAERGVDDGIKYF